MKNKTARLTLIVALLLISVSAFTGEKETKSPPKVAAFAGGCFWCMEHPFDALPGVISTTSGYTGGEKKDPTYEEVSAGWTGHREAVQIAYDPAKVSYETLLDTFWHNVDPTQDDGQFCDHGNQYRTAIFYYDAGQKTAAEKSMAALEKSGRLKAKIATQVIAASDFWPAEDYHQDYYKRNPVRYRFYRENCGRDRRLREIWGDQAPHP